MPVLFYILNWIYVRGIMDVFLIRGENVNLFHIIIKKNYKRFFFNCYAELFYFKWILFLEAFVLFLSPKYVTFFLYIGCMMLHYHIKFRVPSFLFIIIYPVYYYCRFWSKKNKITFKYVELMVRYENSCFLNGAVCTGLFN